MCSKRSWGLMVIVLLLSLSGCKGLRPVAKPVDDSQIQLDKEPIWAEFVKDYYPAWRNHYWTDKELWGNRGYVVGAPPQLPSEKKEDLRSRASSIGSPVQDLKYVAIKYQPAPQEMSPGQPMGVPEPLKPTTHLVSKGECLWYIAGYKEVYGDPLKWPIIYKANRDKIKDPDLIYPGQLLIIPRD